MKKILVTGGCGFIGSHLVDKLVELGFEVKVYDFLEPQVHCNGRPSYLNKHAQYLFKDIRDQNSLSKALKDREIVFHLASQVGVGQSMYEVSKYVSHNEYGTAVLLDRIVNTKNKVKKILVASSMSIYGEGAYRCSKCGVVYPGLRSVDKIKKKDWQVYCDSCRKKLIPIPTPEIKPLNPVSVYSINKRSQEELCLSIGRAYKIPTVALRYFNAFGPRQSLSNPYTGVGAIFLSRVKNDNPPCIYEDGFQARDFIYISDLVEANILAMKKPQADYKIFNVGRGEPITILKIAQTIIKLLNKKIKPKVLNKFRNGDIRCCYADITKIKKYLGFSPKVSFEQGMKKLINWSYDQKSLDLYEKAKNELSKRGLI